MDDDEAKMTLYKPLNLPYMHTVYDGIPYPRFITDERMEEIRKVNKSRPGDVFIATFAKSGTTWLQNVVNEIMGKPQVIFKLKLHSPWL